MLRGEKEKKDVTNVDTHTDRQTDTQTEKGVNPTSRYSTGFSIIVSSTLGLFNAMAAAKTLPK